ncbi:hypothetical protein MJO29_004914 [Puccinia striiformis f. sp. tritici]|nr:hypothetical protein MJO29_004914 [Puccinia striiformis f. sp. tritici]
MAVLADLPPELIRNIVSHFVHSHEMDLANQRKPHGCNYVGTGDVRSNIKFNLGSRDHYGSTFQVAHLAETGWEILHGQRHCHQIPCYRSAWSIAPFDNLRRRRSSNMLYSLTYGRCIDFTEHSAARINTPVGFIHCSSSGLVTIRWEEADTLSSVKLSEVVHGSKV